MPNDRRALESGGRFFFTVNLLERWQTLLVDEIALLREAVATTRRSHPFKIDAFVVLPDHIHAIWTLPPDDRDFSMRWRLIKSYFARAIPKQERLSDVRIARAERGIWQRRFWEHLIRDDTDYARHIAYCYINPVKHGLVQRVRDWPHSSFHRDVEAGIVPLDWARRATSASGDKSCRTKLEAKWPYDQMAGLRLRLQPALVWGCGSQEVIIAAISFNNRA